MTAKRRTAGPKLKTYRLIWEIVTRANFELQGELVLKATCPTLAIARAKERIGYRYAIPDEAVETPYCAEVIARPRR